MKESVDLFIPGRLCLFGEHSDWAGALRTFNSAIEPGEAIVTGISQGIYATVRKNSNFIIYSKIPGEENLRLETPMVQKTLREIAYSGGYFSYVTGVASYVLENYHVGGLEICINKMTLPIKRGLSSSAAICVLVAKAFNQLYDLQLSTNGIMRVAFYGEQRTPSRCGRLDQACAYGIKPVYMRFDCGEIETQALVSKAELHYVIVDLMAKKDTVKILADLNKAYPYPQTERDRLLHQALGRDNHDIIMRARRFIEEGDAPVLGALMTEAQKLFDEKVAPSCPEELTAPVLHSVLNDQNVKNLTYGGKGVGSQGDGTAQFLAKNEECQKMLCDYFQNERHMDAFAFTLRPQHSVKKAIIPVAGYGTRLYPATKAVKKEFFPVVDKDGLAKPIILVLLEELERAGIEKFYIIINNENDRKLYEEFFNEMLSDKHFEKLPDNMRQYESKLLRIGEKIEYIVQEERLGFGHAVYQCKRFVNNEPVLLALGDTLYSTKNNKNCTEQLLEAFESTKKTTLSIHTVPLKDVVHYGMVAGKWTDSAHKLMEIDEIREKPTVEYAGKHMGIPSGDGKLRYYSVFGEYVLMPEVFYILEENIKENRTSNGEIQLTDALETEREKSGLCGFAVDGEMFDVGIPEAYAHTVANFK